MTRRARLIAIGRSSSVLGLVVGISVMHALGGAVFDPNKPEPWTWFAITDGYHAVGQMIVAVLVSGWR